MLTYIFHLIVVFSTVTLPHLKIFIIITYILEYSTSFLFPLQKKYSKNFSSLMKFQWEVYSNVAENVGSLWVASHSMLCGINIITRYFNRDGKRKVICKESLE